MCMEKPSSDDTGTPDTSHLSSSSVVAKKSKSKLPLLLLVVLLVVAALAAAYYYKTTVMDKQGKDNVTTNTPSPKPTPKKLTPEEQMSATLTDGVKKEIAELQDENHDKVAKDAMTN